MEDGVRLRAVSPECLDGFCRGQNDQFHATLVSLTLDIVHDRQASVRAGTDNQARAAPRDVFFDRKRCVTKGVAELLRRLLLSLVNLPRSMTTSCSYVTPSIFTAPKVKSEIRISPSHLSRRKPRLQGKTSTGSACVEY
jgi:hypothetical protein